MDRLILCTEHLCIVLISAYEVYYSQEDQVEAITGLSVAYLFIIENKTCLVQTLSLIGQKFQIITLLSFSIHILLKIWRMAWDYRVWSQTESNDSR